MLYGSPGVGNMLHLAAELFNIKAGIKMEHVPYRGASEVLTALLQGSIQVTFVTPASAMALVKEGKLRAIGTTGAKPFAGVSGRAAGQRDGAGLSAVELVGNVLRASENAAGDRR